MGYKQRAASLAEQIRIILGLEVALHEGSKGFFEIFLGDRLVYSKTATRRIPKPKEIFDLLDALLAD